MSRKPGAASEQDEPQRCRADKWLWAARFFKTRSLAMEAIGKGRISIGEVVIKPSREIHVGDEVRIQEGAGLHRTVVVLGLSNQRGPAPVAQALYSETDASKAERAQLLEQRRLGIEPAQALAAGRPTKKDRRDIGRMGDWQRWSASLDDS